MARWKLMNAHYLNVPGNEWEQRELDTETGKQARKVYSVPQLLDPKDPADCNRDGEIIVCDGKGAVRGDVIFTGLPTPDMEPIDDEAQALSDAQRPKWVHPIESLPGQGFGENLLAQFQAQIAALVAQQPVPAVSIKGVDPADFAKLQEQVAALMAENTALKAQTDKPARRI